MTRKQRASKDRRLQSVYGVTLDERTRREREQGRRCAVCRKRIQDCASKLGLHVDHFHKLAKVKVYLKKLKSKLWRAYNAEFTFSSYHLPEATFTFKSRNKRKAKKEVTRKLKRAANRGLLCWPCNSALRRFHDDPVKMRRAAEYIEKYFRRIKKGEYDFCNA